MDMLIHDKLKELYEELDAAYSAYLISNININEGDPGANIPSIVFHVEFSKNHTEETIDSLRSHLFEKYLGLVHQVQMLDQPNRIMIYTSGVHINCLCLGVYEFDHINPS